MKILKIGASWCSSCLVMGPRWEEIEKDLPWLKTQFFDFDQNPEIVKKYKLEETSLPVFIFLDQKEQEFLRLNGEISKEKLQKIIKENKNK